MDRLAYYKARPTQSIPHRPGPVQCVRNCPTCVVNPDLDVDIDAEELIAIAGYDNLLHRRSVWWPRFWSVQYHPGQVQILKRYLRQQQNSSNLFIVATTETDDLDHLKTALDYEGITEVKTFDSKPNFVAVIESKQPCLIPIEMTCCYQISKKAEDFSLLSVIGLRDLLNPVVERALDEPSFQVNIVPVVITKDYNRTTLWEFKVGSVCINILEPYSLQQYLKNIKSRFHTGHLVTHLYYDMARNAPRLPTHLVAFILYNVDERLTREKIVHYLDWLRNCSMEMNLQIAFTGDSNFAVDFALHQLANYYKVSDGEIYITHLEALRDYAHPLMPNIAYYGVISRAIIMINNVSNNNKFRTKFDTSNRIRVMRDDVIEQSCRLAEFIDEKIPCRRPCATIEMCVLNALDNMEQFGKYFMTEEPAISKPKMSCPWAGDYDSDDDYYESKRNDPKFKSWLRLTIRQDRLDKLNLFMNSITSYLRVGSLYHIQ